MNTVQSKYELNTHYVAKEFDNMNKWYKKIMEILNDRMITDETIFKTKKGTLKQMIKNYKCAHQIVFSELNKIAK